jgi:alkylation response protein AidB-like acyl-CoA dehydrogenase
MRFTLSDDQQEIKRTAHDLLSNRSTMAKVREAAEAGAYDDALTRELGELGWPGIAVSEEHGGQGLGIVELAVLVEELGYACAPVPFLGSALAALPGLASGELRGALGSADALIPDAPGADVVVVVDAAAGSAHVADGIDEVESVDPTRRHGRASASGEALEGDVSAAVDRALVAVSAELVGVCQRALDMTVAYVKERKQFGVPVGTFQAVHHGAAQMLLDTEGGRAATYYAAWAADADPQRLPMAAAMAKAWTSDAGRSVTGSAIQLHGGIGFTWEADVHWLYKRAQLDSALLGSAGAHRARIAALAGRERAGAIA